MTEKKPSARQSSKSTAAFRASGRKVWRGFYPRPPPGLAVVTWRAMIEPAARFCDGCYRRRGLVSAGALLFSVSGRTIRVRTSKSGATRLGPNDHPPRRYREDRDHRPAG